MARLFNDAASDTLKRTASVPVTGAPLTMACWFRSDDQAINQNLMSLGNSLTSDNFFLLDIRGAVSDNLRAISESTLAIAISTSAGAYTANQWDHAAGVFASTTSCVAYLNGVAATADTTAVTPVGINQVGLGVLFRNTDADYLSGRLAEAAIWNAALDAAEVAALAKGISPLLIRPQSLIAYWPLLGNDSPELDRKNGFTLTATGTTKAEHTRVYAPTDMQ